MFLLPWLPAPRQGEVCVAQLQQPTRVLCSRPLHLPHGLTRPQPTAHSKHNNSEWPRLPLRQEPALLDRHQDKKG